VLQERLPANVYAAWYDGPWSRLEELRNLTVNQIIADGPPDTLSSHLSPKSLHKAHHEIAQWGDIASSLKDPTYEEIARKVEEEDQYYAWLIREAQLTPLEADVTRLKFQDAPPEHQGDRFAEQEIADMLGRSLGSVKQAWHRAKPKIERVLRRAMNE
jgi:hypothetical protein